MNKKTLKVIKALSRIVLIGFTAWLAYQGRYSQAIISFLILIWLETRYIITHIGMLAPKKDGNEGGGWRERVKESEVEQNE